MKELACFIYVTGTLLAPALIAQSQTGVVATEGRNVIRAIGGGVMIPLVYPLQLAGTTSHNIWPPGASFQKPRLSAPKAFAPRRNVGKHLATTGD
jgi:hypothetical protein